eukprot:Blabericola_migrator_1__8667@NODE_4551_length_1093_cov_151_796296_g2823_i0_p1_GENE_NODE_4551_length_1093_cov_151_796296_g2823_i0NODE_4551_length_1093_cov_151_796296_g2823_i0_p1_ORF_typecomplete_len223_score21_46_NODE_4551_length_1093_cov_151_796296_g2823_i035703
MLRRWGLLLFMDVQAVDYVVNDWYINDDIPGGVCPEICTRPLFDEVAECITTAPSDCQGNATISIYGPNEWGNTCTHRTETTLLGGFENLLAGFKIADLNITYSGGVIVNFDNRFLEICPTTLYGSVSLPSDANHHPAMPESGICTWADLYGTGYKQPDNLNEQAGHRVLGLQDLLALGDSMYVFLYVESSSRCGEAISSVTWKVGGRFDWQGKLAPNLELT